MTPEMAFECLLVSHDPSVFSTMGRILQDFSIHTNVCSTPSRAADLLADGGTDLIVIDLESEQSSELMHQIAESQMRQKPTILGVSSADRVMPGVHIILRKPVTPESGAKSLRTAYSRMLRDYRKHTRFALMTRFLATDDSNRVISGTVTKHWGGWSGSHYPRRVRSWQHLVFWSAVAWIGDRNSHPSPCSVGSPVWSGWLRVCPHLSWRPLGSACLAREQVPVQEALGSSLKSAYATAYRDHRDALMCILDKIAWISPTFACTQIDAPALGL